MKRTLRRVGVTYAMVDADAAKIEAMMKRRLGSLTARL